MKLRPDYPEAWNNLGMIAAQQGAVRRSDPGLSAIAGTHGHDYAVALLNLGNLYRRQHAFAKAQDNA